ncbi:hypothetical protein HT102_14630 [Hoyosella sp. G463]|uniref:Uncharacterized protein n=1 Tax=Lolliginicoccus lacisalsi TaxID=2742202 RepID=A0A927JES7_9ACTN|nr:hypothetical protein [Lolliginicoccus lacisalsi]MBD8507721.1 hypothetical protein [Lolliginicoccus lacisalsi]
MSRRLVREHREVRAESLAEERGAMLDRLLARWRRRAAEPLDPDADDLVLVAGTRDPAVSVVDLIESSPRWSPGDQGVLRFDLAVPGRRAEAVVEALAAEGYSLRTAEDAAQEVVTVQRVGVITGLWCAQEGSRMASLLSRHGGDVLGWEAWQRAG